MAITPNETTTAKTVTTSTQYGFLSIFKTPQKRLEVLARLHKNRNQHSLLPVPPSHVLKALEARRASEAFAAFATVAEATFLREEKERSEKPKQ